MACPFLEYRSTDGTLAFDHTRPYCALQSEFVSPMDADVCNDRFDFHHSSHCETFRQYVAAGGVVPDPVPAVAETKAAAVSTDGGVDDAAVEASVVDDNDDETGSDSVFLAD
jgi:hypothetical protein